MAQLCVRTGYVSLDTTEANTFTAIKLNTDVGDFRFRFFNFLYWNIVQKTHQDGFTQTRKVLFNCRKKLTAFLPAEPTAKDKETLFSY